MDKMKTTEQNILTKNKSPKNLLPRRTGRCSFYSESVTILNSNYDLLSSSIFNSEKQDTLSKSIKKIKKVSQVFTNKRRKKKCYNFPICI